MSYCKQIKRKGIGFILLLLPVVIVSGQCSDKSFLTQCATSLGDYQFTKAYKINKPVMQEVGQKKQVEYSYVMKKGTDYKLAICSQDTSNKLIFKLYDNERNLIASSYDKDKDKHYSAITFSCQATDTYYLVGYFEKTPNTCGVGILGFK